MIRLNTQRADLDKELQKARARAADRRPVYAVVPFEGIYQTSRRPIYIECRGDSIKTWLNGVPAADLKDSVTPSGFIALQVHGVTDRKEPLEVRFRNLRIKELK